MLLLPMLPTPELARLIGVHTSKISLRQSRGMVTPVKRGYKRRPSLWSALNVLQIGICRDLRHRDCSDDCCAAIWNLLGAMTIEQLESHIAAGRRFALVVNNRVHPRLLNAAALHDMPIHDAEKAGVVVLMVDVARGWATVKAAIEKLRAEKTKAKAKA